MLKSEKWLNLQLFAGDGAGAGTGDGGDGGAGEAAGVEAADPGRQRLAEKGVPEAVLNKYKRSYSRPAPAAQPEADSEDPDDAGVSNDNSPTEEPEAKTASAKPSWEEISKDPDYQEAIQGMIRARLKEDKGAAENLKAIAPALEVLARDYGIDVSKGIDYAALAKAVEDDDRYYEEKALEMGVDLATAKKADQDERNTARANRQQQDELQQQMFDRHMSNLEAQAAQLKQKFPNFDLRTEMKNPAFQRMTSPYVNVPVETAYYAIHQKEIESQTMQVVAQKSMEKASAAIRSGSRRPVENGAASQAPSVLQQKTYAQMTPDERRAFRDAIHRNGSMPLINRR